MDQVYLSIALPSHPPRALRLRPQDLGAFFVPKQNLKFNPAKFPVPTLQLKIAASQCQATPEIASITFLDFKTLLKQTLHPPKQAYE